MTDHETPPQQPPVVEPTSAETRLDKRSAILGTIIGLVAGGAIGVAAVWPIQTEQASLPRPTVSVARPAAPPPASPTPAASLSAGEDPPPPASAAHVSFAQQGEDLIIIQMLRMAGIRQATYIDIGAHDPVVNSNTYWLYRLGGHGVLVEPNPAFVPRLKTQRPRDTVVEVGVGVTDQTEADYYMMEGDGQTNTFSKKQMESLQRVHHMKLASTIKRRLVKIDDLLAEHFKAGPPDVLSIDVEGMDYEILKTLDWNKWRPLIVCVETADVESGEVEKPILELLEKNGYEVRGGTFVNTIFLDVRALKKHASDAGPPG